MVKKVLFSNLSKSVVNTAKNFVLKDTFLSSKSAVSNQKRVIMARVWYLEANIVSSSDPLQILNLSASLE